MKVPDLSRAADAGVVPWTGSPEGLKSAAQAAKLDYLNADLHGVASKYALLEALASGLKLPAHFGKNWDALADALEDEQWMPAHGAVVVLRHCAAYQKAHPADWATLSEILQEAVEYWQEKHKPLWIFLA